MSNLNIQPLCMGKALAVTNFIIGLLVLVAASLGGMKMTGVSWSMMMILPVILALLGLMYGIVGITIYNMMAKDKPQPE